MRAVIRTVTNYYDNEGKYRPVTREVSLSLEANEEKGYDTRHYKLNIGGEEIRFTYYEWDALCEMMRWIQK